MFRETQREKHQLLYLLTLASVWTAFGVFFGTQSYIRSTFAGRPASLSGHIISWILCGYSWGLLTIPIVRFVNRFSLKRLGSTRFILVQLAAAFLFALTQLGIYLVLSTLLIRTSSQGLWNYYTSLVVNELQSGILVYFSIVAAATIYDRFFRSAPIEKNAPPAEPVDTAPANGSNGAFARRLSVKDNGRIVLVETDRIHWIESYGNYVFLHTPQRKFIYRETMAAMEKKLDPERFIRIRRSTIVNVDQIKELHPADNGEFEIVLLDDNVLASTRRYRKNLEPVLKS